MEPATAHLQSQCVLDAPVGGLSLSEGEYTQALKLVFDSQTQMI